MLCSLAAPVSSTSLSAAPLQPYPFTSLMRTAHRHACRRLRCAELEDCTIEFAEHMLLHYGEELECRQGGPRFEAWLDRCARNYVEDYCRRQARRSRREIAWPEQEDESGVSAHWETALAAAPCDASVLRGECQRRVMQAIQRLAPKSRALFLRHHLHGETLTELAHATGNTPDAVRMTVSRACKQVRATLEWQGMTDNDADEYLAVMRRGGGG